MLELEQKPVQGTLLIAHPVIRDPNFRRTVVLLCEHNEDGTYGLVLNRPTPIQLNEVVENPAIQSPLFIGGPVQPNTLHILHRIGSRIDGSKAIRDGICWGGDLDDIAEVLNGAHAAPQDVRFYVGYSGWGEGQLDEEIERGGWLLMTASNELIFNHPPEDLWRVTMRNMGGEYALVSTYPDDSSCN